MKKRTGIYILIGCITPIIITGLLYLGLAYYYSEGFSYGIWVNDLYCTGKSVEAINTELLADCNYKQLVITDKNQTEYIINLEDIDFKYDYSEPLSEIMSNQNSLLWGLNLIENDRKRISANVSYNEEALNNLVNDMDFMKEDVYDEKNKVEIVKTDKGYELMDHTKELLVPEKAMELIENALAEGKTDINLKDSYCYEDLPESNASRKQYELFEKIDEFQDFKMTYSMGDTEEVVDASVICNWIMTDDRGNFVFDEDDNLILDETMIREYVNGLGEEYDTLNRTREFKSTRGDIITLEGGTYGNDLDEEAEYEYLLEAFTNKATDQVHEPEYIVKAKSQGNDDIGGTYIEVDLTLQRLYFYKDYDVVLDSPIVSGNLRTKCGTPVKVCYIYYKQKNRTLRGDNYASFVYYWMAIYKNIGIHDATWRSEFGGDIYKTSGSHGCINMPKAKAKELYELADKGTPVIVFY